jgi:hypothetical protein
MKNLLLGVGGSLAVALLSAAMQVAVPRAFVYVADRLDRAWTVLPGH